MAAPIIASAGCGGPGVGPLGNCGNQSPFHKLVVSQDAGLPDGGLDCAVCSCFVITCQTTAGASLDCTCAHDCTGRRPRGLLARQRSLARHPVGALFAEVARLEAASVRAFQVLGTELAAHGAPHGLVERARRSAREEVRHARMTAALARRYGASPLRPEYSGQELEVRSLEELAVENAREGCVRETFGVLVGSWQASHAADPRIASAMRSLAPDELRHAELAWDVAEWANARLGTRAKRLIRRERADALAALGAECRREPAPPCVHLAGIPSGATARALANGLSQMM